MAGEFLQEPTEWLPSVPQSHAAYEQQLKGSWLFRTPDDLGDKELAVGFHIVPGYPRDGDDIFLDIVEVVERGLGRPARGPKADELRASLLPNLFKTHPDKQGEDMRQRFLATYYGNDIFDGLLQDAA